MLFASITLQGAGLTSVSFVNIPFSIPKGRFLLLNPLLSAGGRHEFAAYWKHQYRAPLSWGSMEFSAFLLFVVWTSSMTYSTFGKGEWHTANHFLSLYSFFSQSYLIFHHSLFLFRWFTTVNALSLLSVVLKNLKSWTQETWILKEVTSVV